MIGVRYAEGLEDLMVPYHSVTPHPLNPNNGDVDELVIAIMQIGCYRPIFANARTTHITGGHTLYAALGELGAQMIPVVWSNMDDEDELRALLGDNKIARLGRLDPALELEALQRLKDTEGQYRGTGYDEREIERMAEKALKEMDEPLQINLGGNERLIHEIECPACGHTWVRGQGKED